MIIVSCSGRVTDGNGPLSGGGEGPVEPLNHMGGGSGIRPAHPPAMTYTKGFRSPSLNDITP